MTSVATRTPVREILSAPFIPMRLSKPRDRGRVIEIHGVSLAGDPVSFVVPADLFGIRGLREASSPMRFVWESTTESLCLSRVEAVTP